MTIVLVQLPVMSFRELFTFNFILIFSFGLSSALMANIFLDFIVVSRIKMILLTTILDSGCFLKNLNLSLSLFHIYIYIYIYIYMKEKLSFKLVSLG